jgi:hypothetical protein
MSALRAASHKYAAIVLPPIFDALCCTYFQFLLVTVGASGLRDRNRPGDIGATTTDLALLANNAAISDSSTKLERAVSQHSLNLKPKTSMPFIAGPGKV